MAQSNPRAGRGQPARAAAKSKKPAASEVEAAEDAPGTGIDAGIAILTCVVLVAALLCLDKMHGVLGNGIFFTH